MIVDKISEAINFLSDDDLVWSDDFETIRKPLANLLMSLGEYETTPEVEGLLDALLESEITSIHPEDPMVPWMEEIQRQLGIVEYTASRSERMAAAIKRLFREI